MEQEIKCCFHCKKDHEYLTDCYYCSAPYPVCIMIEKNGGFICPSCTSFLGKDNEKNECGVCYEEVELCTLPCNHKLCLPCCKRIYDGYTYTPRPKHSNEVTDWSLWPYTEKEFDEYCKFEDEHEDELLLIETFEEYVVVRDKLKSLRPAYMNTEEMIEYENDTKKYDLECARLNEMWEEWEKTKCKGSEVCPFCRSTLK